ncbi:restriction endonuclease [Stenotrophomonas indicatrix]|uniref:restriction endonuclease subunit S n=1 Tax=Stenotrophomonas indicatrix TaxID=2045451 RepID=UPI000C18518E|nr:restriction endonuclease subunit S [Stenotrophomonas indicatrix]PII15565.1 restriction endonuclease [Stenotrophomonas indicatrix]
MNKIENFGALVPNLRFPEFQEANGWALSLLETACDMQAGKFVAAAEISAQSGDGLFPCYGGNGLRGYTRTHTHSGRYSLIGRQGSLCGNVTLVNGRFHATEHAVVATPKAGIHTEWLFYELDLLNLNRFATGQALPGLSVEVLKKVECAVPRDEAEQKKIADCLTSLDELITLESKKLDAIKLHKKGLMQHLFPGDGEAVPKLRFPEFWEAGSWEIRAFKKLFSVGYGRDYKHLSTGNVPVYGSGGYMLSVDDYLYDGESVCIGRKGTINNPMLLSGRFWTVDTLFYTHSFSECLPRFIYAIFQRIDWLAHNEAGGIPSLSKANIEKIEVAVPKSIEQQKIADCLSSLDELIALEVQKLDALKCHKKGLIQQLFPQVGEAGA